MPFGNFCNGFGPCKRRTFTFGVERCFTARIQNIQTFIMEVEKSGLLIPEYPIQVSLTSKIRRAAQQQNNKEFTALWAGQSAFKSEMKPVAEIFTKLIKET